MIQLEVENLHRFSQIQDRKSPYSGR